MLLWFAALKETVFVSFYVLNTIEDTAKSIVAESVSSLSHHMSFVYTYIFLDVSMMVYLMTAEYWNYTIKDRTGTFGGTMNDCFNCVVKTTLKKTSKN